MAPGRSDTEEARRRRQAAALRENLKRRKAQSRAMRDGKAATDAAGEADKPDASGATVTGGTLRDELSGQEGT